MTKRPTYPPIDKEGRCQCPDCRAGLSCPYAEKPKPKEGDK